MDPGTDSAALDSCLLCSFFKNSVIYCKPIPSSFFTNIENNVDES